MNQNKVMVARRVLMVISLLSCVFAVQVRDIKAERKMSEGEKIVSRMEFPELNFKQPTTEKAVLENGLTVYSLESASPFITLMAVTGGISENKEGKEGLPGFAGYVIKSGGIAEDPSEFFRELEGLGISFNAWIGVESGQVSLRCLREDFPKALDIFKKILTAPRYNQDVIALCKSQAGEALSKIEDNPNSILSYQFNKLVYGSPPYNGGKLAIGSRYYGGYVLTGITRESLTNINIRDLEDFHNWYFQPSKLILGVTGDFGKTDLRQKLVDAFKDWNKQQGGAARPEKIAADEFTISAHPGIFFIPKTGLTQSSILMGHIGATKMSDDYFALWALSDILGGGSFTSRLVKEVRVERGLVYRIRGDFHWNYLYPGLFTVSTETKSQSTVEVVKIIIQEIEKIKTRSVDNWELQIAQEAAQNSFVFNFVEQSDVLEQIMQRDYFNLPENYLDTYLDSARKVTPEDILAAARRYLYPDRMTILIVGNPAIQEDLEVAFGKINVMSVEN